MMRERVEQMNKVQEETNMYITGEETSETITIQDVEEDYPDQKGNEEDNYRNYSVLFDPEDEDWYGCYWGYGDSNYPRVYGRQF